MPNRISNASVHNRVWCTLSFAFCCGCRQMACNRHRWKAERQHVSAVLASRHLAACSKSCGQTMRRGFHLLPFTTMHRGNRLPVELFWLLLLACWAAERGSRAMAGRLTASGLRVQGASHGCWELCQALAGLGSLPAESACNKRFRVSARTSAAAADRT